MPGRYRHCGRNKGFSVWSLVRGKTRDVIVGCCSRSGYAVVLHRPPPRSRRTGGTESAETQASSPWCVYISDQVALRGGKEFQGRNLTA